ncbi:MAG: RNase adapter RapZ [Saprospiraceae bacterium]
MSERRRLKVLVTSFTYKSGIPADELGHGGGFVFDCRFIPNPGREQRFTELTGRDWEVIIFLDENPIMQEFLSNVKAIVGQAVATYVQRDFEFLSIQFGCTGGQHRSVYSAEKIAEFIQANYPVDITLEHLQQNIVRGWERSYLKGGG